MTRQASPASQASAEVSDPPPPRVSEATLCHVEGWQRESGGLARDWSCLAFGGCVLLLSVGATPAWGCLNLAPHLCCYELLG